MSVKTKPSSLRYIMGVLLVFAYMIAALVELIAYVVLVLAGPAVDGTSTTKSNGIRRWTLNIIELVATILSAFADFTTHGFTGRINFSEHERKRRDSIPKIVPPVVAPVAEDAEHIEDGKDAHDSNDDKAAGDSDDDASVCSGTDSGEEDESEAFRAVLARLKFDDIPEYCARIRNGLSSVVSESAHDTGHPNHAMPSVLEPIFGGYHAVFPVLFEDGIKYMLKIPQVGIRGHWTKGFEQRFQGEVNTMIMLRKETTIPVPEVFAYNSSLDNELGCPYILMQCMPGKQLYELWDNMSDNADLEKSRLNALKDIAYAMAQLERYSSDTSGCPRFDDSGQIVGTVTVRCLDDRATALQYMTVEDAKPVYYDSVPVRDPQQFFKQTLDRRSPDEAGIKDKDICKFVQWLIRLLLQWTPNPQDHRSKFVLAHPDFNWQNILVDDDGHLTAVIDWDGVMFCPRNIGYEKVPMWLMHDWSVKSPKCFRVRVPAARAFRARTRKLRQHYIRFMQEALAKQRAELHGLSHIYPRTSSLPSYAASSLIVQHLLAAAYALYHDEANDMIQGLFDQMHHAHFGVHTAYGGPGLEASVNELLATIHGSPVDSGVIVPYSGNAHTVGNEQGDEHRKDDIYNDGPDQEVYDVFGLYFDLTEQKPSPRETLAMMKVDYQSLFHYG